GPLLVAGRIVLHRGRRGKPEGTTRAVGLGGVAATGDLARSERALSRAPRPVCERRRNEPHPRRSREARIRGLGDQELTCGNLSGGNSGHPRRTNERFSSGALRAPSSMEKKTMPTIRSLTRQLVWPVAFAFAALAFAAAAPAQELQEGKQYVRVKNPAPPADLGKKIEVIEFFSY